MCAPSCTILAHLRALCCEYCSLCGVVLSPVVKGRWMQHWPGLVHRIAIGAVGVRLEVHFAALRAVRVKLKIVKEKSITIVSARVARLSKSAKSALIESHLLGH